MYTCSICCVFRPANGCPARRSLVEIDFLTIQQLFPSLTEQNKQHDFLHYFIHFMTKKYAKSCFSVKKLISTSEQRAKHPFAGQNTQELIYDFLAGNNYPNLPHKQGGMKFATQISPLLNSDPLCILIFFGNKGTFFCWFVLIPTISQNFNRDN